MASETKDQKYYWLKLKKDFFKRHDIRILESKPNGKDYILFYLKLLCESVDHNGNLRFSESIPYDLEMLSVITNTNIDTVRTAIDIFAELKLIEILDNGTYYMSEVKKMMGSETYWAERKRIQRQQNNLLETNDIGQCPTCPSKSIDIDKDIELDNLLPHTCVHEDEDEECPNPTFEEVKDFIQQNDFKVNPSKFYKHYNSSNWMIGTKPIKNWKAVLRAWELNSINTSSATPNQRVYGEPDWLKEYEENFMNGVKDL
jgi:predicted phage replisome organizer